MSDSDRIKLLEFQIEDLPDGQRQVRVELGWREEDRFSGTGTGPASDEGACISAAEAAIQALETAADGTVTFDLEGVSTFGDFDSTVVIVFLIGHTEREELQFLGACLVKDEHISRYAALAVLTATNRFSILFDNLPGLSEDRSEPA